MRDVRNEVGFLDETMEGLSAVGRTMTFAVTTPLVALGSYAAQAAVEFDSSMRNINSILQLSEGEFQNLSSAILDFGTSMRAGPMGAAEAMYTIVGAGITDVGVALDFMNVANKTAEAGLADVERTTSTLIASFLSFGGAALTGADAMALLERQSDVLTQTVAVGVGSLDAFATSFAGVVPTVTMIGGSFEDTGGLLAYFTQRGLSAATAGVSLNAALTALIKPTDAMKAAFGELGVASGEELVQKFGGLEEALIAVIETSGGSSEALGELFANIRAQRAVGILSQDLEGAASAIAGFTDGLDGATDRAHMEQLKSFASHIDLMRAAVEGAAIAIGEKIMPNVIPFIDAIADAANSVSQLNPELIGLGVAAAALVAATGPLLWVLSSMLNPLAALVTVTSGVAAAWATDFLGMREAVNGLVTDIFGNISGVKSAVQLLIDAMFPPAEMADPAALLGPPVSIDAADVITFTVPENGTLWDVWVGQIDHSQFSWEAFKTAVGWGDTLTTLDDPGEIMQISPTLGTRLARSIADTLVPAGAQLNLFLAEEPIQGYVPVEVTPEITLNERLENAKQFFDMSIAPMLAGLVERGRIWFDNKAGEGISWFTGLFTGAANAGGKTPLSTAFEQMLDGDLTGAINTVIPGLGDKISTGLSNINVSLPDLFPKISKALGEAFDGISKWVISEGLPTLARMAGTLGGHLATSLYDAIQMAVGFITNPALGAVGGEVAAYGEGLMGEMVGGFNAALSGTDLQTTGIPALQAVFDQISGLADTLEFDFLVEKMGELGTSIGTFFSTVASADFSGVARIIGAVIAIGNVTLGGFYDLASEVLPVVGTVVRDFINTLADVTSGDGMDVGARITAIADSVKNLLGIEVPSAVEIGKISLVPEGYEVDTSGLDPAEISRGFDRIDGLASLAMQMYMADHPLTVGVDSISVYPMDGYTVIPEGFEGTEVVAGNMTYLIGPTTEVQVVSNGLVPTATPFDNVVVPINNVTFDFSRDRAQYEGMSGAGSLAEEILPTGTFEEQFRTEMDAGTAAMGAALAQAMAEGGVTDPAIVTNDFLIPVQNAFQTYLGEGSGTIGAIRQFASAALVSTAGAMLSFTTLGIVTGLNMTAVKNAITTNSPLIRTELGVIKGAVDNLKGAFEAMAGAATAALTAAAAAMTMSAVYGGARAGGGSVTGGQTYLVGEEGPELFTPPGNGNIISNGSLRAAAGGGGGGGGTYIYNTTINEAMDLDAIEREARRRGLSLFGGRN